MSGITVVAIFFILSVLEIGYFNIAKYYKIIDKPNHRSSHTIITVRGGGIIFTVALLLCPVFFGIHYPLFLTGLFLIAAISFIDDVISLNTNIRLAFHLTSAALIILQLNLLQMPLYFIPIAIFIIIGVINAVNFMDGINGITGIYALVALGTLYYLNITIHFTNANYLLTSVFAVLIFDFFNCRTNARCFAGDVGSVGIAYIIIFFILQLIVKTENIVYLLLMLMYGLDTATTIIFRLFRKENITEAHRSHFYQFLANEKAVPHLFVSLLYGLSQLLINIVIIKFAKSDLTVLLVLLMLSTAIFIILRFSVEGKKHLLTRIE